MDISFKSLLFFIVFTMIYFINSNPASNGSWSILGKPKLTLNDIISVESKNAFYGAELKSLAFYLLLVVCSQFCLNIGYLMSTCGSSLDKNIGSAALYTFIPWILIFGVTLATLIIFPGFKTAFSDVIGYFAVSGSANDIFSSILIGTDINNMINASETEEKKQELTMAAEAIVKICGNKSILINQMNTDNFLNIWNVLKPLMVPGAYENVQIKQQLLDLVVFKDNIGEFLWYLYTAILISSIVYYNLATKGCVKSVSQIKEDHDAYVQQKEDAYKQKELTATTYTVN